MTPVEFAVEITEPSELSFNAIREYAAMVGEHHNIYGADGCADMDALMEKLGATTIRSDRPERLYVAGPGAMTIALPHFTSARRQRFRATHALGHYFLHYLYPKAVGSAVFRCGKWDRMDTQANVFAAALLMPEGPFRTAYVDCGGDAWAVSAQFGISPRAVEVRAEQLGILIPHRRHPRNRA